MLLMVLDKAESFTAVWNRNGSYDWLLHDSLFTSLQNEVHSDADIIIYYSCYYVFSELHSVRPCNGMYIQKFVKGAVETSWLKFNIFFTCALEVPSSNIKWNTNYTNRIFVAFLSPSTTMLGYYF